MCNISFPTEKVWRFLEEKKNNSTATDSLSASDCAIEVYSLWERSSPSSKELKEIVAMEPERLERSFGPRKRAQNLTRPLSRWNTRNLIQRGTWALESCPHPTTPQRQSLLHDFGFPYQVTQFPLSSTKPEARRRSEPKIFLHFFRVKITGVLFHTSQKNIAWNIYIHTHWCQQMRVFS